MKNIKHILWLIVLITITVCAKAQIPSGYYNAAIGKSGSNLFSALGLIVNSHNTINYSDMDTCFPRTDKKSNGKVWDIYSYTFTNPQPYEFSFGIHECDANLNYQKEGDCFNKEHTWPQSFFNSNAPMRSDLHMVFPTDGWVNNKRSNYPYGNTIDTTWESDNGSILGHSNSYAGYTGLVFEPIDSFKGDIARALFYFSTCYQNQSASWQNWTMAVKSTLTADAAKLLLAWHHLDPISSKEINRNEQVYKLQNNRNPYIDYPFFADCIWGAGCTPLVIDIVQSDIRIYPNPARQTIFVEADEIIESYKICNLLGISFLENELHSKNATLDFQNLSDGFYVLSLKIGEKVISKKINIIK